MIFPSGLNLVQKSAMCPQPNKHYSVSQKSMVLSLLCLIGLRRNQIERDNCVPVTFPLRQADTGGRRALREGQGMRVRVGLCVQYFMCANVYVAEQKEAPQSPPCCCSMLHRASGPQVWCPTNLQRETTWRKSVCMSV